MQTFITIVVVVLVMVVVLVVLVVNRVTVSIIGQWIVSFFGCRHPQDTYRTRSNYSNAQITRMAILIVYFFLIIMLNNSSSNFPSHSN